MALASKGSIGGSLPPFFKPEDHGADLALIVEPLSVRKDVPGKFGARDHVRTKVTVFRTQESLDKGQPTSIDTYEVNSTVLARDLIELLENARKAGDDSPALITTVRRYTPKGGGNQTWVFRDPADADYAKAERYYNEREAKLQAALAEVPDF